LSEYSDTSVDAPANWGRSAVVGIGGITAAGVFSKQMADTGSPTHRYLTGKAGNLATWSNNQKGVQAVSSTPHSGPATPPKPVQPVGDKFSDFADRRDANHAARQADRQATKKAAQNAGKGALRRGASAGAHATKQ